MIRCDEIKRHLDDWLDDLLAPTEQHRVASHLQDCADCRRLFERHREITEQVWALGQAADRLAAAPAESRRAKPPWISVLRIAAAVLVVVTTGFVALQFRRAGGPIPAPLGRGGSSGEATAGRSLPKESFPVKEAPSDFSVTVDDSYMAVRLESSNPRIQIVWLYPMVQPAEPESGDDDGDANDTSS